MLVGSSSGRRETKDSGGISTAAAAWFSAVLTLGSFVSRAMGEEEAAASVGAASSAQASAISAESFSLPAGPYHTFYYEGARDGSGAGVLVYSEAQAEGHRIDGGYLFAQLGRATIYTMGANDGSSDFGVDFGFGKVGGALDSLYFLPGLVHFKAGRVVGASFLGRAAAKIFGDMILSGALDYEVNASRSDTPNSNAWYLALVDPRIGTALGRDYEGTWRCNVGFRRSRDDNAGAILESSFAGENLQTADLIFCSNSFAVGAGAAQDRAEMNIIGQIGGVPANSRGFMGYLEGTGISFRAGMERLEESYELTDELQEGEKEGEEPDLAATEEVNLVTSDFNLAVGARRDFGSLGLGLGVGIGKKTDQPAEPILGLLAEYTFRGWTLSANGELRWERELGDRPVKKLYLGLGR